MPSLSIQQLWLSNYPENNVGLPLGGASGLCAIDIDTEDQELVDAILGALPTSPWVRVGKKGMGLIYRWSGQKNFKLRDKDNKSIVERSEEHTSELQSLMRISYAVFCLKKKKHNNYQPHTPP